MLLLSPTALVVDDSASIRRILSQALQHIGVDAVGAVDGADAWRRLQSARPDVILTDINMPIMDGLKLIRLVRAGGPHQRTPIVVITTESAEEDRRRAIALGASAYLVKPVQPQQVLEVVRPLLDLG
jgi:two-component system, chemotaxis family, chemotaxis protein CheY